MEASGLELRLAESRQPYETRITGVEIRFVLTSHKAHDVNIRYSLKECISAYSNQGQMLEIGFSEHGSKYLDYTYPFSNSFETITTPLQNGLSLDLYAQGGDFNNEWVIIVADTADPYLTEIIVAFTGLNGIENAQWRILVYH